MEFIKMQGLGNDYLFLNCLDGEPEDLPGLAVRMSDRHFGAGSDGLICLCPSELGDFRMKMFNADGSEGEMCGNGIRCLARYIREQGLSDKKVLDIETRAGLRRTELLEDAASCRMCRMMMINAGLSRLVVRNTPEKYTVYQVADWVFDDDSILEPDFEL